MSFFRSTPAFLLLSLLPLALSAQAEKKTTPAFEETGEPEGNDHTLPPSHLDPRIWNLHDPLLLDIARRVEAGTAPLPMARSFDRIYTRLFPFNQGIPGDWRERAARAELALRPATRELKNSSSPLAPASTTWALIGPSSYANGSDNISGRATAVYVDPLNKNNIILGTADGGIWKTTDQGLNWSSITGNLTTLSIGSIAVDPNNASVIYAGTGEGNFNADGVGGFGIFKSTNGGATWVQQTQPAWPYAQTYHGIRRIAVDPRDSLKVYAAIDGGLYYTLNGGTNWTLTTCGAAAGPMASDVVLDSVSPVAGSPSIVYVAFGYYGGFASNGVYRSTNAATSWTEISIAPSTGFPAAGVGRITLVQAPSDRKQLYALIQNTANFQSLGIYYTADATAASVTWTTKNTATPYCSNQCWYNMHGTVDPTNPAKLIVGGLDDYLSTDNGLTLGIVSQWTGSGSNFSHADHHFLVMPDATTLYDANDGGFFVGTVSGSSVAWVNRNSGLATLQFFGLAQHPTDATKLHGGLQDNGEAYYNGTSWTEIMGGDGGKSAWDQSNPLYSYEEYVYASIYRNSNTVGSPFSWTCIRNFGTAPNCNNCSGGCRPDNASGFISPFTLDANDQNTMYAPSNTVWRNAAVRTGNTWAALSASFGGTITAMHSAKNNGTAGMLYVGVGSGAQVTSNANTGSPPATWSNIGAGLPGGTVTSFTTDPANGQKVLVTISGYNAGHIYRSTTGGTGWVNISGALPVVPFNTIALSPMDPNHAYAGSDFGVYENTAVWTGTTWTSIQTNLPLVAVEELGFNPWNGNLRVATHGRSAWELLTVTAVANPVPDGSFIPGTPLKASKGSGANINVTFDTATCTPGGRNAYWGNLTAGALAAYTYSGSQCGIASGGPITTIPAATSAFFVVVGTDGAAGESRNVQDSAGAWHGSGLGLCSIFFQNSASTCP